MVEQQSGAHEGSHLFAQGAYTGTLPVDHRQGVALPEEVGAPGRDAKIHWVGDDLDGKITAHTDDQCDLMT